MREKTREGERLGGRKGLQSGNEISEQIPDVYAFDLQRDAQHVRARPPIGIKAYVRSSGFAIVWK